MLLWIIFNLFSKLQKCWQSLDTKITELKSHQGLCSPSPNAVFFQKGSTTLFTRNIRPRIQLSNLRQAFRERKKTNLQQQKEHESRPRHEGDWGLLVSIFYGKIPRWLCVSEGDGDARGTSTCDTGGRFPWGDVTRPVFHFTRPRRDLYRTSLRGAFLHNFYLCEKCNCHFLFLIVTGCWEPKHNNKESDWPIWTPTG